MVITASKCFPPKEAASKLGNVVYTIEMLMSITKIDYTSVTRATIFKETQRIRQQQSKTQGHSSKNFTFRGMTCEGVPFLSFLVHFIIIFIIKFT